MDEEFLSAQFKKQANGFYTGTLGILVEPKICYQFSLYKELQRKQIIDLL